MKSSTGLHQGLLCYFWSEAIWSESYMVCLIEEEGIRLYADFHFLLFTFCKDVLQYSMYLKTSLFSGFLESYKYMYKDIKVQFRWGCLATLSSHLQKHLILIMVETIYPHLLHVFKLEHTLPIPDLESKCSAATFAQRLVKLFGHSWEVESMHFQCLKFN